MRELSAEPKARDMEPALFASLVPSRKAGAFREKAERRSERDLPGGQGERCGACFTRVPRPLAESVRFPRKGGAAE